ncbi:hypothetical protein KDI_51590 [Dictyobacter arantiisoli]|uniref:Uncharacterized protein n=1 Tax=Dictyobacter arantiisoli TaxID=2014874 RepID=A0A5A5TK15_9CHLR|nr:hypothetical protein KDI_51590 [Dictyobacter arantiisoli]
MYTKVIGGDIVPLAEILASDANRYLLGIEGIKEENYGTDK